MKELGFVHSSVDEKGKTSMSLFLVVWFRLKFHDKQFVPNLSSFVISLLSHHLLFAKQQQPKQFSFLLSVHSFDDGCFESSDLSWFLYFFCFFKAKFFATAIEIFSLFLSQSIYSVFLVVFWFPKIFFQFFICFRCC